MNQLSELTVPGTTTRRWHHKETVAGESEPLLIPSTGRLTAIAVMPSGSARVEATLSPYAVIRNGEAEWHPWENGDVSENTTGLAVSAVSALRLVGDGVWEVTQ